ncbi:TetR/AcrR family transcriptional regulator [Roseobacter sinensis]|uniref:TetR/AcrR family transcriptional regulator n=1 Tax=Roseobacter sinensis TaxID=2931391 RepID=A0ABT3BFJ8_9RHOB|nr:TetR/AcrR family transcriptional regulator [Roseobacter sp. WL0113]MCV3272359.1 TetR/AcrR family transcriptional regulator [Roseobacter sp. WL0113]
MEEKNVTSRRDRNLAEIRRKGGEVAERLLLEQGYEALSARGLAKATGCSVGALYNAFGHIDGVVREVNLRSAKLLQGVLTEALEQAPPGLEARLIAMAEAYFDFAVTQPQRWRALFDYPVQTPPDGRIFAVQDTLLAMLRGAAGVTETDGPEAMRLTLLWASVHGLTTLAAKQTISGLTAQAARNHLAVLVRAGMAAEIAV